MAERHGPKCGAKRHGTDQTCTLPAGWGTEHVGAGRCRKHLGNSPNVARSAAREQAETKAREVLAQLDVHPVTNPLRALQRLAGQVVAWQEACARLVNNLEEVRYSGQVGGLKAEQLRAEIGMYQDALRQSASVLTSLSKLEIDDRLSLIQQREGQAIAALFITVLARLRLAPELESAVRSEFTSGLLALSAAPEAADEADGTISGVVVPPARPRA